MVEIVHKMSTLHIHIRDPDCIHAFSLSTVSKDAEKFSINFCVITFGHYIILGHAELYGLFGFKFAVTII